MHQFAENYHRDKQAYPFPRQAQKCDDESRAETQQELISEPAGVLRCHVEVKTPQDEKQRQSISIRKSSHRSEKHGITSCKHRCCQQGNHGIEEEAEKEEKDNQTRQETENRVENRGLFDCEGWKEQLGGTYRIISRSGSVPCSTIILA